MYIFIQPYCSPHHTQSLITLMEIGKGIYFFPAFTEEAGKDKQVGSRFWVSKPPGSATKCSPYYRVKTKNKIRNKVVLTLNVLSVKKRHVKNSFIAVNIFFFLL